ncbi:MAG: hypothetical protein ACRDIU_10915 [Actinomycetota bacterium]
MSGFEQPYRAAFAETYGGRYVINVQPMDGLTYNYIDWYGDLWLDLLTWIYRRIRHKGHWRVSVTELPEAPVQRRWRRITSNAAAAETLLRQLKERLGNGESLESVAKGLGFD